MLRTLFRPLMFLSAAQLVLPASAEDDLPRRARRPEWPDQVREVFFEDARIHLSGARPLANLEAVKDANGSEVINRGVDEESWSELIDAESLEIEIKRVAIRLTNATARRGAFQGGKHQECRRDFSMLAALFRVVGEYEQAVRWQKDALGMELRLLIAADACKLANEESWMVAKEVSQELADLIRGSSIDVPGNTQSSSTMERSQLMQRMKMALEDEVVPLVADRAAFRREKQAIVHEAQVLGMLAKLIGRKEFEFSEDEDYQGYASDLAEATVELIRATEETNYGAAETAVDRAERSCKECHEGFRG